MIIIGHSWIDSPTFCKVFNQKEIKQTKSNQIVLLESLVKSHTIAQYCQENTIAFAVNVSSVMDALFANALGASYIVCEEQDATIIQPIANEYLFDTRVLALIDHEKEIPKIASNGVDGVIFTEAIC